MIKQCKICNKEFEGRGNVKVCSEECKLLNKKTNNSNWNTKQHPKSMKMCPICGEEFEGNGKKTYCSNECYVKNNKLRDEKRLEYYYLNKERLLENQKKRNQTPEGREKINKYFMERYNNDPEFRLKNILRYRIYQAVKREFKNSSSTNLLGISIKKYKEYIEEQFDENMSWGNHGTYWEIDHIIPLNTFDLTNEIEQKRAFNYLNTRPLEKIANRSRPKNGSDL